MPKIIFGLPGEKRNETLPVADEYTITVIRADGYACTEIEAATAISMLQIGKLGFGELIEKMRKPSKKATQFKD